MFCKLYFKSAVTGTAFLSLLAANTAAQAQRAAPPRPMGQQNQGTNNSGQPNANTSSTPTNGFQGNSFSNGPGSSSNGITTFPSTFPSSNGSFSTGIGTSPNGLTSYPNGFNPGNNNGNGFNNQFGNGEFGNGQFGNGFNSFANPFLFGGLGSYGGGGTSALPIGGGSINSLWQMRPNGGTVAIPLDMSAAIITGGNFGGGMAEKKMAGPGQISIRVPSDSEVSVNGQKLTGDGAERSFMTPVLEPNQGESYEVSATWSVDDKKVTSRERVYVQAGERKSVMFLKAPSTYDNGSRSTTNNDTVKPVAYAPASNAASFDVKVPANAIVYIQGKRMTQTGEVRHFVSPTLVDGMAYDYEIRATWQDNGRIVEKTRQLRVSVGGRTSVDMQAE